MMPIQPHNRKYICIGYICTEVQVATFIYTTEVCVNNVMTGPRYVNGCKIARLIRDLSTYVYGAISLVQFYNHGTMHTRYLLL